MSTTGSAFAFKFVGVIKGTLLCMFAKSRCPVLNQSSGCRGVKTKAIVVTSL